MKFTVTLTNTGNVLVGRLIEYAKKSKPDCTVVQDELKLKTHKVLLKVFSEKLASTFEEHESPVIVLLYHSTDAIKTVISDLLYDTKVVVNEDKLQGIEHLCKSLGIKIETSRVWEPIAPANHEHMNRKRSVSPYSVTGKFPSYTVARYTPVSPSPSLRSKGNASTTSSRPSPRERRNALIPLRFRSDS